jgi:cytochrome c-type biogenesis protein CcmF
LNMRRAQLAAALGHIGLAVAVIGVAGASAWVSERLLVMKPGESTELAGYTITFKEVFERPGPNYAELAGAFELKSTGGSQIGTIIASKRRYEAPPQVTKQAGISVRPSGDVYVVLGDETKGGAYQIKVYYHPFVRWIWGGSALMFLAGLISLLDRRLRIGLPQGARKASTTSAAAAAE